MTIAIIFAVGLSLFSIVVAVVSSTNQMDLQSYVQEKFTRIDFKHATNDDLGNLKQRVDKIHDQLFVRNYFFDKLSFKGEFIPKDESVEFYSRNGFGFVTSLYCHKDEQKKFDGIIKEFEKGIARK